jgi:hypothetical protein
MMMTFMSIQILHRRYMHMRASNVTYIDCFRYPSYDIIENQVFERRPGGLGEGLKPALWPMGDVEQVYMKGAELRHTTGGERRELAEVNG